ncbi:MAG: TetR/AcrR family transcriptional regulator [Parafilimonas sp.]
MIKDTAKEIFFSEGKLHATTQDIADAACISRTSLHYYYRSRDELMKRVFNEAVNELNGKLYKLMESALPFKEKVEELVTLFLNETIAYPYREIFLVTEMLSDDLGVFKLSEEGAPHIRAFLKEISKEIKAGNIMKMQPVQFMINIIALTSHPLLVSPLHKGLFQLSDNKFCRLMNERKKLIVEMLFR